MPFIENVFRKNKKKVCKPLKDRLSMRIKKKRMFFGEN
jgi:hypothetical protein